MITIAYIIALIGLSIASFCDIRTREIPDWINYTLIAIGFAIAGMLSIMFKDYWFILGSVIGFAIGFALSYIFYKAGQWGGGDAKMLMALGALVGVTFTGEIPIFFILIFNIFIVGAIYGMLWSIFLAVKHRKEFKKSFKELIYSKEILTTRKLMLAVIALLIVFAFIAPSHLRNYIIGVAAFIFFIFYFYVYSKSVEKSCMEKMIPINKLTEGDWVLQDIFAGTKKIVSIKNYGITREQIEKILKTKNLHKLTKVKVKEGIPFLPSFLIAFIITWIIGNWLIFFA
ncbi:prepilin peptidase [archaeon]|nr:prepilin peptidase [archaeon]MBL7057117.1 prepilin peptidase [Candidatus Woesearchaeota archaeon]